MRVNPYHWIHNISIIGVSYILRYKAVLFGKNKQYSYKDLERPYPRKPSWQLTFAHFQTRWFVNTSCSTSKNLNISAFSLIAESQIIGGVKVFIISPLKLSNKKKVLYLHGGAFIKCISQPHIDMLFDLANRLGCEFYVPLYTLADHQSYPFQKKQILQVYTDLQEQVSAHNIVLMGDSAGGNLACGLIDSLISSDGAIPSKLILISPWVNLLFNHPELRKYEKRDNILSIEWLDSAIKKYVGDRLKLSLDNPKLSPINSNNLGQFPSTLYFTGDTDMFYPDSMLFKERALKQGMNLHFIEVKGGFHVFPAAPAWLVPEANISRSQIASFVSNAD